MQFGAIITVATQENVEKLRNPVLQDQCVNIRQMVEDTVFSYYMFI